eukprot:968374_1
MGQPLSVFTALLVLSTTTNAGCLERDDIDLTDRKIDCRAILEPGLCEKEPGCRWKLPSSLTMVWVQDDILHKYLPPIEAVTEYIGDIVYYEQLRKYIPQVYDEVLSTLTKENLKITKSAYEPLSKVVAPGNVVTEMRFADVTSKEEEHAPVQTLLEYSRPFLPDAKPFDRSKLTLKTFTLSDVVSIGYIAWWDALTVNNDRFVLHARKVPNKANMMLYERPKDHKWVYVPIDQGLATLVTLPWFKWLKLKTGALKFYKRKEGYKQVIFSEEGLDETVSTSWMGRSAASESKHSVEWREWYTAWLRKKDKADEFVNQNLVYFPKEVDTDDELKKKK